MGQDVHKKQFMRYIGAYTPADRYTDNKNSITVSYIPTKK